MIVYIYTFPNGKKYIGQTTLSLAKRAQRGWGYHNQLVYKAIQKYGWENIQKEIINCSTEEEMDSLERELIIKYKTTNINFGYNVEDGGHKNKHLSEETKQKISETHKGIPMTEEAKKKLSEARKGMTLSEEEKIKIAKTLGQPIICIETQKIYDSVGLAAKKLGIDRSSIYAALNGKCVVCLGYHWKWLKDYNENEIQNLKPYKHSEKTKQKLVKR